MSQASSLAAGSASAEATSAAGRVQWSTRMAFILAAAGSAVGLGNIWKFPYITGENGGGAFVLVYLACILIIGIPVMMAEIALGRRGRHNPAQGISSIVKEAGAHPFWKIIGGMALLAGFMILCFYSIIAGWAFAYVPKAASGAFVGASADEIGAMFGGMLADPVGLTIWGTLVLAITMWIVSRGLQGGLEKAINTLMPGLLVLLLVMVGYAMSTDHFEHGLEFLFAADFSKLTASSVLVALGHAFFTLSLASGAIMTYGSYLPKNVSIVKTSLLIAFMDTAVALLAGLAIFPLVFANGLEPGAGPGLIFVTLPIAFGQMPFGTAFGAIFFILLAVAALTSAISLLEPTVSWMTEKFDMSRAKACALTGLLLWVGGIGVVLSLNIGAEWTLFGKTFFDMLDYLTANWMMPLGGLMMAIFCGWVLSRETTIDEMGMGKGLLYKAWLFTLRYVSPIAIIVVFLNALGVIQL
ncbi:sodium-dependent transporter [Marinobacterium arenosum]|uniref:sodium-dependent transporter n=1 Tax=Marinobacterium arenosum TaxID=2862496 RepID=UPI001C946073|nr:sodium-dependent transporter [Marinobacterium arenosum]MBY4675408.1 sodium-dependent transporter [Marinobacterium arenosum]